NSVVLCCVAANVIAGSGAGCDFDSRLAVTIEGVVLYVVATSHEQQDPACSVAAGVVGAEDVVGSPVQREPMLIVKSGGVAVEKIVGRRTCLSTARGKAAIDHEAKEVPRGRHILDQGK